MVYCKAVKAEIFLSRMHSTGLHNLQNAWWGAVGIAAVPAFMTGCGLTNIFFAVISEFIIEKQYLAMYEYCRDVFWRCKMFWQDESTGKAVASIACYLVGECLKVAVGLALNIAITWVSSGVFSSFRFVNL